MTSPPELPWDMGELEVMARSRLTPEAAVYYETTAIYPPSRENERAWQSWRLVPRFGIDVSDVTTEAEMLGTAIPAPILLAPCAFAGYADPDGEWAVARAAAKSNVIYVVSSASSKPPETVPGVATASCWLQLYVPEQKEDVAQAVYRAEEAGFEAIVVTVDAPIGSLRHVGFVPYPTTEDPFAFARVGGSPLNPKVTWRTVQEIADLTSLPLLVKGVLHPGDARSAYEHGARGVIVSNHGGRQLDGVVPTALVIEEIAQSVADRMLVLVDGGIRSGRDVLRALALGAHGALVGRPYLWALAVAGEAGVDLLLRRLQLELENALALTGCRTVHDVSRDLLTWHPVH
ncbi:MAG TPA: alpha-hydroxy acid oxidase [Acidimicrobiales bacterium]|nr:alpha-hydroxy acid oxidase [Acidimicrobiales bacterium]